jgi:hypothetical protein
LIRRHRLVFSAVMIASLFAVRSEPVDATRGDGLLDVYVRDGRGVALAHATIEVGSRTGVTDMWGRASISDADPGTLTIRHLRFPSRSLQWTDTGDRVHVVLGAPVMRAIHVAGTLVGTRQWDNLVALAERTSINAFMLDLKDESGRVFSQTASSWAITAGANLDRWDLADVTTDLHRREIYVIARIVAFQDPIAGKRIPDMAVRTTGGQVFTRRGQTFLDATDPNAREYALQLAEEACAAGVDEVQFDYVRYPDADHSVLVFDGGSTEQIRVATITGFLAEAKERVGPRCQTAADIFGFVTSVSNDGGIGHQVEALAEVTDVLSPMVYPNHWGPGWFGYTSPEDHPGGVIDQSMRNVLERTAGRTTIRPWLQDFGGYGPAEVRAQIDAADSLGLGWMLWNAGSVFTEGGIPLADEVSTPSQVPPPVEETRPPSGFWDVPAANGYGQAIAWLGAEGITQGCNPPWRDDYCPDRELTRGEAATLLVRAFGVPATGVDRFVDDDGSVHEANINALAVAGITVGCDLARFCAGEVLTRQEMASMIARALDLPAVDTTDTFVDDDGNENEADIERIAAAGITRGCTEIEFCPLRPIRRDEAAAMLFRALG